MSNATIEDSIEARQTPSIETDLRKTFTKVRREMGVGEDKGMGKKGQRSGCSTALRKGSLVHFRRQVEPHGGLGRI